MYTFSRSEKNKPIAEEYETRAMLYLMNKTWDESLDIFLIDSFNDVSGTNQHFNYIVDLQAKGIKDFPPSKIGESLITLFLNYISDFTFDAYILFCKSLNNDYLIESRNVGISSHTVEEISDDTIERIKKSLVKTINKEFGEEYLKVLGDGILSNFFEKLHIVVDDGEKSQHIKSILPIHQLNQLSKKSLEAIFENINNMRVSLKTNINLENQKITRISECLAYKKHLQRKTIESLVITRLVGYDIFKNNYSIPLYFSAYTDHLGIEEKKDLLQNVNSEVSKAFFDVNNSEVFFGFIDFIMNEVKNSKDVNLIIEIAKSRGIEFPPQLTDISAKFLISMIIGGLYDN